ncbi:hypothetical protein Vafri_374 [Volvox africanus]|nr:hypothetical protein Vafri_374 [Volvox africanus]
MMGLVPSGVRQILQTSRPLQVFACAAPAAALIASPKRSNFIFKATASLGAAAFVPCLVFALIRRTVKQYIFQSVSGPDLRNIETFYSTSGAGHGSAFWVAEIIEQGPVVTAAPDTALTAQQPSAVPRPASTASSQTSSLISNGEISNDLLISSEPATSPAAVPARLAAPAAVECETGSTAQSAQAISTNEQAGVVTAEGRTSAVLLSAEADERHIRELVAGMVAGAVARIEAASSRSPTTSPRRIAPPEAALKAPLICRNADDKPEAETKPCEDTELDSRMGPKSVPVPSAVTVLATPAGVVKGPRIASFSNSTSSPVAAPAFPVVARSSTPAVTRLQETPSLAAAEALLLSTGGSNSSGQVRIIGHVALERKSWKLAELRRLSVLKQYGGQGVGGKLLETLVQHAHDNGFQELVLHTSGLQTAARRLYERAGWSISRVSRVQGVDLYTYTLDLTKKR